MSPIMWALVTGTNRSAPKNAPTASCLEGQPDRLPALALPHPLFLSA